MAADAITHDVCIPMAGDDRSTAIPDRRALSAIRLLFDRNFYLSRYGDVAASGIDPLDHFLTTGLEEGRSPTPLFDPDFYQRQPGVPAATACMFLHYLKVGIPARLDPHPLVDAAFYVGQAPALPADTNPLTHMLAPGRRAHRRPNPLFDPAYYRRRLREHARMLHPLIHYVMHGWRERLQPHPLFDPATYLEQRPDIEAAGIDPLAHYLRQGRREQVLPHWLFDPGCYVAGCAEDIAPAEALLHYAATGGASGGSPNPLFDPVHYLRQHPGLARSGAEPFLHFLEFGLAGNRDPHPLFDTWFYRSQNGDVVENDVPPFIHYVRYGAREGRDPNPFFPVPRYLLRHPEARDEPGGPLAHFLRSADAHLQRLCDGFDPAYYLACHPACGEAVARGETPLGHYLSAGRAAGLSPRPLPVDRHPWRGPAAVAESMAACPAAQVLMIVPDASDGGPASCALRAAERLAADPMLGCRIVVGLDGPLLPRFAALAPTLLAAAGSTAPAGGTGRMADVLYSFRDASADGVVILAGMAMPEVASLAGRLGLKLIAWLHETPVLIDSLLGGRPTMRAMADAASCIVTRSEAARATLIRHYALPPGLVVALRDGITSLFRDDPREASARLRQSLGLPPDALVVMGGGRVGFRSGTDLFIRVAELVTARVPREAPAGSALHQACFVWIGGSDDPLFDALCRRDIDRLGLSGRVRLLGPQDEADRMLAGADLFLQTDREPILDGAGHAARNVGISVIRFREEHPGTTGSQPDRLVDVPYLDLAAMADAVLDCGNRPARRLRPGHPAAPDDPGWDAWHRAMRGLIAQACGMSWLAAPPADAAGTTPLAGKAEARPGRILPMRMIGPVSWPGGVAVADLVAAD